jgi:hypothetical protein
MHRQRALGAVLAAIERVGVRPALALGVDVDAADLVGEGVDEAADGGGSLPNRLSCWP